MSEVPYQTNTYNKSIHQQQNKPISYKSPYHEHLQLITARRHVQLPIIPYTKNILPIDKWYLINKLNKENLTFNQ